MKNLLCILSVIPLAAMAFDISKYDSRMAIESAVVTNGVRWIDGTKLPNEGRMFDEKYGFYCRLPDVSTNVNNGVRSMKWHTSGIQFRFVTNSKTLRFKWVNIFEGLSMHHMPSTGMSGIDVYRQGKDGKWRFVKGGSPKNAKEGGSFEINDWESGVPCLVNLPLYNGIKSFSLGIDENATISAPPPRKSGITRPVVFYGTSITHGGCCSRPGLSFVNIAGREADVPVVNLGFSGSGVMEFEMSEHLAAIDASCYVLDCLWNMGIPGEWNMPGRMVNENYEPFIRNLRAKRPGVPIIMAEQCDVFCKGPNLKDKFIRKLYDKLVAEGWKDLYYLPKTDMYPDDFEGTVDGCHPNDWGMMWMAKAFGKSVKEALKLK